MLGACWAMLITSWQLLDGFIRFALPIILIVHHTADIIAYQFSYSSDVAYISHIFGMATGFALTISWIAAYKNSSIIVYIIAGIGFSAFTVLAVYLCYHFYTYFPPRPLYSSFFKNKSEITQNCCAQLFLNQLSLESHSSLQAALTCVA